MESHELPKKIPRLDSDGTVLMPNVSLADENNLNANENAQTSNMQHSVDAQQNVEVHARCKFYIEKKKRCCKTQPPKGQQYCATHAQELGV